MNKNKKSKQANDNAQDPRISFRFNNNLIELPLSKFNMILNRELMKLIDNIETGDNPNFEKLLHKQYSNIRSFWTKEYNHNSTQACIYESLIKQLENDLRINEQAQPKKNWTRLVNQNINTHLESNQPENINVDPEIVEISDDDDINEPLNKTNHSTNSILVRKKQESNSSSINLVGAIEEFQKLKLKIKTGPKSKTRNVAPNNNINSNYSNETLPVNVEASTSKNKETFIFTFTRERKSRSETKTSGLNKKEREKFPTEINTQNKRNYKIQKSEKIAQEFPDLNLKKSESRNDSSNNINNNCNNETLTVNVEASTSLNKETCISTFIRERKSGSKTKRMLIDNEINCDNVDNRKSAFVDIKTSVLNKKEREKCPTETNYLNTRSYKIPKLRKTAQEFPDLHLKKSESRNDSPNNIINNCNNEGLPVNIEASTSKNKETCISTFTCEYKSESMTKTSGLNEKEREKCPTEINYQNIRNYKIPKIRTTAQEFPDLHLKKSELRDDSPNNIINNCNNEGLPVNVEASTSKNKET